MRKSRNSLKALLEKYYLGRAKEDLDAEKARQKEQYRKDRKSRRRASDADGEARDEALEQVEQLV